jgi:hypothetical protein
MLMTDSSATVRPQIQQSRPRLQSAHPHREVVVLTGPDGV